MGKHDILRRIEDSGVVAVIRAKNREEAEKIADACIKGGIAAIEITFTVPGAEDVIEALCSKFDSKQLLVGAGTILDSETARVAILKGAEFIVSPAFNLETAKLCNRYQVPYMPGCMTITEIITAMEAGVDIIKVFPGSVFGPDFIKAVKGPLPQVKLMPTGGVNLSNVEEWIKSGCVAIGIGSDLTNPAKTGNFTEVEAIAKKYIEKVKSVRC